MKGKHVAVIAGSVLIASALVAFGPVALKERQQRIRDESLGCANYRLKMSINNLQNLRGRATVGDYAEAERSRRAHGCTPVD